MNEFFPGQSVTFREYSGKVNFIGDQYITLTIKEYCIPKEDAQNCRRNCAQVNILVFRQYWDEVVENQK